MENLKTRRFCMALDLQNDEKLIEEYIEYHRNVWPEIKKSISESGIVDMEIYHVGDRLFMIIEANEDFSFEKKARMDSGNPKVEEWEKLMWKYQKALPCAKEGEKWLLMKKIFKNQKLE